MYHHKCTTVEWYTSSNTTIGAIAASAPFAAATTAAQILLLPIFPQYLYVLLTAAVPCVLYVL